MGGKRGKQQRQPARPRLRDLSSFVDESDHLPSSAYDPPSHQDKESGASEEEDDRRAEEKWIDGSPSKFELYQRSVQSPKGDISYMQKFFLMYVGGRMPLHLQEDFCGTALLSCEWIRSDPRRTAVGLDLDLEALNWCLEKNLANIGIDGCSRISLFHGNVLKPQEAHLVKQMVEDFGRNVNLGVQDITTEVARMNVGSESGKEVCSISSTMKEVGLPGRDIICAFNYSCCCLQRRTDLVMYFKHALHALSKKGGIFVMDVYGGTSAECKLRLKRKFPNFTYVWEQADFDIINRTTRISLHFQLGKKHIIQHAFSYNWRLWSLPEIQDCLKEAGFCSVHFWVRTMPNTNSIGNTAEDTVDQDLKYEELSSFQQQDAWNAYIVGVAN
ncbi:uncharacterized protein LOC120258347 [Dioscorea cayenensis subsp. rotundata]|uniref:Uncharacterized protein LOC120258347 n=1 Tax=Dioscorea cayennensis subsp. rotundata TaxID=55577 RepID=A0AB40B360_DIOCR|nr:uncharacterized protein LOC120258347 [Dioscorea cayenensis subsp. rotundata]